MRSTRLLLVLACAALAAACLGDASPTTPALPVQAGSLMGGGQDLPPDTTTVKSDTTKS